MAPLSSFLPINSIDETDLFSKNERAITLFCALTQLFTFFRGEIYDTYHKTQHCLFQLGSNSIKLGSQFVRLSSKFLHSFNESAEHSKE